MFNICRILKIIRINSQPISFFAVFAAPRLTLKGPGRYTRNPMTDANPTGLLESKPSHRFWFAAILAGVSARLFLWWFTLGTNDPISWWGYGAFIAEEGLAETYRSLQLFNHPPLMGLYAMQMRFWSGDDQWVFAHLMKLPGLVGEAIILWALWRFAAPKAAAVYALLPAAILVSGFHGNTDCFCAAFVLVAVIAFDRQHFFLAGLLMAASLNVKLIPLTLLPMVLIGAPNRRALVHLVGGLGIGVIPFVGPALTVGAEMYRNMVAYNSIPDNWGLVAILNQMIQIPVLGKLGASVKEVYLVAGRYAVMGAVTGVAIFSKFGGRRRPMAEQAALGMALFLILTPGFGVQYVISVAPLLCLVDLPQGLRWGCLSGLFIGVVYWGFRVTAEHFTSLFHDSIWFPAWLIGLAAWAVLVHFVWGRLRERSVPTLEIP